MRRIAVCLAALGLTLSAQAYAKKSLTVDLSKSTVYAFEDGRLIKSLVINPGDSDNPTRPGHYAITQKVRDGYRSNLVNVHNRPLKKGELGAPMDYWMRLGGTGMGFHRSSLWKPNGRWGSHGCLRMSRAGARWLFDWTPKGTSVTIVSGGTTLASAVSDKYRGRKSHKSSKSFVAMRPGAKKAARVSKPVVAKAKAKPATVPNNAIAKAPVAKAPAEKPADKPATPVAPKSDEAASEPAVSTVTSVKPEAPQPPSSR
jgi:hypothetical protein